jgi:plasmid stability protein
MKNEKVDRTKGRSMEEEARQVLTAALKEEPQRPVNLADAI